MLEVKIRQSYAAFTLDVEFATHTPVAGLFGPSGAGKTAVLNCVAGLSAPQHGRIRIDERVVWDSDRGIALRPEQRDVAYVFQDARLFPHLSVRSNLLFGAKEKRKQLNAGEFDSVVKLLGLSMLLDRRPASLSGGEKQRVAIGRAVLSQPRLLLMDEPLSALDTTRRFEILSYVRRLREQLPIALLYVSHSAEEMEALAAEVIVMREGRVVAAGRTDQMLLLPEGAGTLRTFADSSVITARVVSELDRKGLALLHHPSGALKVAGLAETAGASVRLRVHARDVILAAQPPKGLSIRNALKGHVASVSEVDRAHVRVGIALGPDTLNAIVTHEALEDLGLVPGADVYALIKATAIEAAGVSAGMP